MEIQLKSENIQKSIRHRLRLHVIPSILFGELKWVCLKWIRNFDLCIVSGINEVRHLRRCSRSGVCTQMRNETPLPVWDHRFLHRSFCFGLWTRAAPRSRKRPAGSDLVQEVLEFKQPSWVIIYESFFSVTRIIPSSAHPKHCSIITSLHRRLRNKSLFRH